MKRSILSVPIHKIEASSHIAAQDLVAVEEPLQVRIGDQDVAITMRTPGQDRDLAVGFLFTEGLIKSRDLIVDVVEDDRGTVTVTLTTGSNPEIDARRFYVASSCGVCGKASIDALRASGCTRVPVADRQISAASISHLPARLREAQTVFEHTGGLHAAGLFTGDGDLLYVREDVGRHNAVDKVIGAAFLERRIPLHDHVLMLSGRVSFELVQKAAMAGIAIVAAVGAPSSLAVETALRFGITLIGFVRDERFNVYAGPARLAIPIP